MGVGENTRKASALCHRGDLHSRITKVGTSLFNVSNNLCVTIPANSQDQEFSWYLWVKFC